MYNTFSLCTNLFLNKSERFLQYSQLKCKSVQIKKKNSVIKITFFKFSSKTIRHQLIFLLITFKFLSMFIL